MVLFLLLPGPYKKGRHREDACPVIGHCKRSFKDDASGRAGGDGFLNGLFVAAFSLQHLGLAQILIETEYIRAQLHAGFAAQTIALIDFHLLCRSEEHTSELQSHAYLVCRLLLEKSH